jgi:hypothetical protein
MAEKDKTKSTERNYNYIRTKTNLVGMDFETPEVLDILELTPSESGESDDDSGDDAAPGCDGSDPDSDTPPEPCLN